MVCPMLPPAQIYMLKPNVMVFGNEAFGRELELDEVMTLGLWSDRIGGVLKKREKYPAPSLSLSTGT